MSTTAPAISFDEMIQADRKKKKNEALAEKILGSGRRASAPGAGSLPTRKSLTAGTSTLASRVGVQKRSSSTTRTSNIDDKWGHDLHHVNNPRVVRAAQINRPRSAQNLGKSRLAHAVEQNLQGKGQLASIRNNNNGGASMSIRGMAATGPFVVIASNFASGTSAADIKAAMEPVGGEITSCYLLSQYPTVMAELLFVDKEGAENVVATFNNQKADGRLLYVYIKPGGPSPRVHATKSKSETYEESVPVPAPTTMDEEPTPPPPALTPTARQAPARNQATAPVRDERDRDVMDVDDGRPSNEDSHLQPIPVIPTQPREDRERRREPSYQDGRYGFNGGYDRNYAPRDNYRRDRDQRDRDRDPRSSGLYSDGMYNRHDNRGYRR